MSTNRMVIFKFTLVTLLVAISQASEADTGCTNLNKSASSDGFYIPGEDAGRTVTGKERLQFYSAPSLFCPVKGAFILQGESVDAYTEYDGFTSVVYLGAKSKYPVTGWVQSSRLKANGNGIAPPQ